MSLSSLAYGHRPLGAPEVELEDQETYCEICRDVCLCGDMCEAPDGKMVCEYCMESYE